jgi:hypothetical protein
MTPKSAGTVLFSCILFAKANNYFWAPINPPTFPSSLKLWRNFVSNRLEAKTCVHGRRKRKLHLVFEFCELTVLNELEKHPKGVPMQQTKSIVWQTLQVQHMCSHCILIVTKLFSTCEIRKSQIHVCFFFQKSTLDSLINKINDSKFGEKYSTNWVKTSLKHESNSWIKGLG